MKDVDQTQPLSENAQHLLVGGRVQGVGFRPFVYRLALRHALVGWVRNQSGHVEIVVQGMLDALARFAAALIAEAPPLSRPQLLTQNLIPVQTLQAFTILPSAENTLADIHVPPDYFVCDDCLKELQAPGNRRYRYPFINCTQCGPRYTLISQLPYDRPNTTMAGFALCQKCQAEYENPLDRRFHAEPIACPACGPQLAFNAPLSMPIVDSERALAASVSALREGKIVAVKGVGGYHLLCDATNGEAVAKLRASKKRPHKPLAVMFPLEGGLENLHREVVLCRNEERFLLEPTRAILLAPKHDEMRLSDAIAPGLGEIGVMLPYSPLHHLLLNDFGGPVVATSANISGEPVLTDNAEVEDRLVQVADAFLHHNRPIERPADDPVFRVIAGKPRPLRLGRGCAPLELALPFTLKKPVLAVGAHTKNTVALAWDNRIVISPHIGDMGTPRSLAVFEQLVRDFQTLYGVNAKAVVCDAHPGYVTSKWAERCGLPVLRVYHHHAHASALAGEFPGTEKRLVFTWDGVGLGEDRTLWGGEAFVGKSGNWKRVASFRPFYLPGGEKAGREPWRSAAALCWEVGMPWQKLEKDSELAYKAWERRINCPPTSAVGRLFDAAASLVGLMDAASFEGQGPMLLEAQVKKMQAESLMLPLSRNKKGLWETDWSPLLPMLRNETQSVSERAACFHATMAHALLEQARTVRKEHGVSEVGLSGGVFQNRVLAEQAISLLEHDGFVVHFPEVLPCNDAGISFGQIMEMGAILPANSQWHQS